jgi:MYXO-CTERM domain-containing protein
MQTLAMIWRIQAVVPYLFVFACSTSSTHPPAQEQPPAPTAPTEGLAIPSTDRLPSELFQRISPVMGTRHLNQPAVVNQTLFLGGNAIHEIWNISDPTAPVRLAELVSPHAAGEAESHQLAFARLPDGSLHAATISGRGIDLWNITSPSHPTLESSLLLDGIDYGDFTAAVWGIAWQGHHIYVGGTNTGLHIVDATDPTAPYVIERVPTAAFGGISAGAVFALGNLLVVTTPKESSAIATLDISDPIHPTLLDLVDPPENSYIGGFYGRHAFLQTPLRTYDVTTDPHRIQLLGTAPTPTTEYMSFAEGNIFLGSVRSSANGVAGVLQYRLGEPSAPQLVGHVVGRDDPGTDDQFSTPIGNLIAVADDEHLYGAFLAVHATARDTAPPTVLYANPADNAGHQAVTSRIGLSFSEPIELRSVTSDTVIVRPVGGQPIAGRFGFSGTLLAFSPSEPLLPGVSYEVILPAGGVTDIVGNPLAADVRTRFTTVANAVTPPPCALEPLEPALAGQPVTLRAQAADETRFDYRLRLGDGTAASGSVVAHRYATPGRYPVALTVTDRASPPNGPRDHYEAEAAALAGGVIITANEPGFEGTGFADFPATTSAQVKLAWNVVVAASGTYVLAIRYGNGDPAGLSRKLRLRVDGALATTLDFVATPNDWSFRVVQHTIALGAGTHAIELVADAGTPGPNVDRLSIPVLASSTCIATQIVHRALTATAPSRSSTIVVGAGLLLSVNPDANTVTAVSVATLAKAYEVPVGRRPRSLARLNDDTLIVANQDDDSLTMLAAATGARIRTIALPYGSQPVGVAAAPDGTRAFVALQGSGRVLAIDPRGEIAASVALGPDANDQLPKLRGLAVSGDGARLYVTRFVSPPPYPGEDPAQPGRAELYELDASTLTRTRTITLGDAPGPDTPDQARGIPNYLGAIAISPDGMRAWLPSKQDNMRRGLARDGKALTHDGAVRPIVSAVDLATGTEVLADRIDLNDSSMPIAAELSPHGDLLFVALQGANRVEVRDAVTGRPVASIRAGRAPEGLVLDLDGRLFIHDVLDRTITVVDASPILAGTDDVATPLATVATVERELLSPAVLRGKQIFHDASDRRMSKEGYISCASCHLDGDEDGRVWDFTDRNEGLRNTITLLGRAGTGHGRIHFTANFDEIQDFENDIRNGFGGAGFLADEQFAAGTRSDPLGDAKAGLSAELDALAAYVASLGSVPRSPYRNADGTLSADGAAGKALFQTLDCGICHRGPTLSDDTLHDVGTLKPTSGTRRGHPLTGIETQTLVGVFATAPYFHDGSARTLRDVLDVPGHGNAAELDQAAKDLLVAYLRQIDDREVADLDGGGCGCGTSGGSEGGSAVLVMLLGLLVRRRRR